MRQDWPELRSEAIHLLEVVDFVDDALRDPEDVRQARDEVLARRVASYIRTERTLGRDAADAELALDGMNRDRRFALFAFFESIQPGRPALATLDALTDDQQDRVAEILAG